MAKKKQKETIKEAKARLKKSFEDQKIKMKSGYKLARNLGVPSFEASKISGWSRDRIREYAKED
ncbi:MAG: hypothetical protein GY928_25880 [Colwellia sp.]|nr:hypothetical protein [Colwellia sp.]